jgi:hypothetical protein
MVTPAISLWLEVLDSDLENLRAGLDWSLASGQPDTGARLVCAISQAPQTRCLGVEGVRRCPHLHGRDLALKRD